MSQVLHELYVVMWEPQPPSVNNLYRNGFAGKRVLSKAGQEFKSALTKAVVDATMTQDWKKAIDAVYIQGMAVRVVITIHGPIRNKSWKPGRKTEKGSLQSPYKKKDGSSYIKAIEDAVVSGVGIDDSCHLEVTVKKVDDETSYVEVAYEVLEEL